MSACYHDAAAAAFVSFASQIWMKNKHILAKDGKIDLRLKRGMLRLMENGVSVGSCAAGIAQKKEESRLCWCGVLAQHRSVRGQSLGLIFDILYAVQI